MSAAANIVLAVATLILAIYGVIQARATKQMAEDAKISAGATLDASLAARKSAEAALLNAQAVINSERPWVFANLQVAGEKRKASVYVGATNGGRTPARVTRMSADTLHIASDDDYPTEPPYPNEELTYPVFLSDKETLHITTFLLGTEMTDEMWEDINAKKQRLVFFGHVVYSDLLAGEEHETRFCYFLSPAEGVGLVLTGPRNYNKHT